MVEVTSVSRPHTPRYLTASRRVALVSATVLAAAGAAVGAAVTHASAATQATIFVSPTGNDANAGTSSSSPVRTPGRAQALVRAIDQNMTGDIRVQLADGTYRLTAPLTLNGSDSGTNGHNVIWTAASGARPVISGAVPVTGWTPFDTAKNIWSAPVPAGLNTRQLYVNGRRAARASGSAPVTLTWTTTGYTASAGTMSTWRNAGDIEFVYRGGLGAWTEIRCSVGRIASNGTVTMGQPCWDNSNERYIKPEWNRTADLVGPGRLGNPGPDPGGAGIPPTSVENAFELLDQPGEWYLDRPAARVYYIPRSGETMSSARVEAPVLQQLVTGTSVQHVVFNGLQFSYATWLTPSSDTGFSEIQAGYTITGATGYKTEGLCTFAPGGTCPYGAWTKEPANVSLSYARNVQFTNDGFVHLGAAGLDLGNGSANDLVKGNVFTDISGNGIELGGVDKPLATGADRTSGNTIADNHIFAAAVEYHGGIGILVGYAEHTLITHNQLDTLTYTAISIGWGGWPDKKGLPAQPNFSNHNTISNNLIFNYMQLLNDGGGIYTQGRTGSSFSTGERVTGNVLHGQHNRQGHVVYTDNGAAYISILGNAMYDSSVSSEGHDHNDTTSGTGKDPMDIEGNYWTKGRADTTSSGLIVKNNHPITSPSQIPSSIVDSAGLEPAYQGLLNWKPA
jgi:glycosyl hydrolase family 141